MESRDARLRVSSRLCRDRESSSGTDRVQVETHVMRTPELEYIPCLPSREAIGIRCSKQYVAKAITPGRVEVGIETERLRPYVYGPGDMIVCRRYTEDWIRWRDPISMLRLELPDHSLQAVADEMSMGRLEFVNTPCLRDKRIAALFTALEVEQASGSLSGRLFIDSIAQAMVSALAQICGVVQRPTHQIQGGLSPAQLRRVSAYIHDLMHTDLNLVELAAIAGLSRAHFSRMFRLSTGMPPHRFVLDARIARAKVLLSRPETRILDVAITCGFQTAQHFARVFRSLAGTSPTGYRKDLGLR